MVRITAILLALATAAPASTHPYLLLWQEAVRIGGGDTHWTSYPVTRVEIGEPPPADHLTCRTGRYELRPVLERDGTPAFREQVTIWVRSLLHRDERLLHEYLHAIWVRRCIKSGIFARKYPNSEQWVRSLTP